ncbi:MAG: ATP synthase subunit I [Gammaproteobacteria bacterium]|nr:ATP synthase subunit I [Gammaproteobacteria bacterium]MBV9724450.1 ATP synthase subunit I [Gammaproteobacteria bacterium]
MSAIDLPRARRLAFRVVLGQAGVTLLAGLLAWALSGERAGWSALAGGGIATARTLAMAVLVMGGTLAGNAGRALGAFYIGEALKLVIVAALFVVVLKVMRVAPLAMFGAFAATFLVYWIALLSALPAAGGAPRGA